MQIIADASLEVSLEVSRVSQRIRSTRHRPPGSSRNEPCPLEGPIRSNPTRPSKSPEINEETKLSMALRIKHVTHVTLHRGPIRFEENMVQSL